MRSEETKKSDSKKKRTSWQPEKTVMRDLKKGKDIPWEPQRTVMKILEETYQPRKNKKTKSRDS